MGHGSRLWEVGEAIRSGNGRIDTSRSRGRFASMHVRGARRCCRNVILILPFYLDVAREILSDTYTYMHSFTISIYLPMSQAVVLRRTPAHPGAPTLRCLVNHFVSMCVSCGAARVLTSLPAIVAPTPSTSPSLLAASSHCVQPSPSRRASLPVSQSPLMC